MPKINATDAGRSLDICSSSELHYIHTEHTFVAKVAKQVLNQKK